ncbi:MAG: hypothetical protein IJB82_04510 [Bacilli bacterium]|nr:hypothetical protein [Bacilli bacterium]
MKKEYLSEENYKNVKGKISKLSLFILLIGIIVGGLLITIGILKNHQINLELSEENIQKEIDEKTKLLEEEKEKLNTLKEELKVKINPILEEIKTLSRVKFDGFNDAYYEREDRIDELEKSIKKDKETIDDIESFNDTGFCYSDKVLDEVCDLQSEIYELENINIEFKKRHEKADNIPFFMFGGFIIVASSMFAFSFYIMTKRREIAAFSMQQMMPLAEEGIEKMAPTIGKAGKTIVKEMAPMYGEIAKEISKGIKEGLSDEKKDTK